MAGERFLSGSAAPIIFPSFFFPDFSFGWLHHERWSFPRRVPFFSRVTEELRNGWLKSEGPRVAQVLVFGPSCQGAILVHSFEPQPNESNSDFFCDGTRSLFFSLLLFFLCVCGFLKGNQKETPPFGGESPKKKTPKWG